MKEAVELVMKQGLSIRSAALRKGLAFQTVSRYVKKYVSDPTSQICPNYSVKKIFSQ